MIQAESRAVRSVPMIANSARIAAPPCGNGKTGAACRSRLAETRNFPSPRSTCWRHRPRSIMDSRNSAKLPFESWGTRGPGTRCSWSYAIPCDATYIDFAIAVERKGYADNTWRPCAGSDAKPAGIAQSTPRSRSIVRACSAEELPFEAGPIPRTDLLPVRFDRLDFPLQRRRIRYGRVPNEPPID